MNYLNQDYYGYVYIIIDQKHDKVYVGQKKGKIEDSQNYFGSGSIISDVIKGDGFYFLKKIVLGVCYSKEELTICETECKHFFKALDRKYGYNIIEKDTGGDTITNHPKRDLICEKISLKGIERFSIEENKIKQSIMVSNLWKDDEYRLMQSNSHKGHKDTEQTKINKKKSQRESYTNNPERAIQTSKTQKEHHKNNPERAKKQGEKIKGHLGYMKGFPSSFKKIEGKELLFIYYEEGKTIEELSKIFNISIIKLEERIKNYYK